MARRDEQGRQLVRVEDMRSGDCGYTMDGRLVRYQRRHGANHGAHYVTDVNSGEELLFAGCAEVEPETGRK